jgi:hypothetical protein
MKKIGKVTFQLIRRYFSLYRMVWFFIECLSRLFQNPSSRAGMGIPCPILGFPDALRG